MAISMQTNDTIQLARIEEIEQTKKILASFKSQQSAISKYLALLVKQLGTETERLWEQGFLQNKDLSEMIVLHPTMVATDKIMFLDYLVQDSDLNNAITAYTAILKTQKRRMKEFEKKAEMRSALEQYLK
jgi:hypothetical protein